MVMWIEMVSKYGSMNEERVLRSLKEIKYSYIAFLPLKAVKWIAL